MSYLGSKPMGRAPVAPINLELVREKATDIRYALARLRQYGSVERNTFLEDETTVSAAKYQFVVAIEAAQALCNHLAARIARQAPMSYGDCYTIIQRAGVIPPGLGERLVSMVKFRNLLVHKYGKVDDARVYEIMGSDLGDLEEYLDEVLEYLERRRDDETEKPTRDKAQ
ncbi:MAG: DUF86 domain-containing protein [Bacillota bacterium]